MAKFKLPFLVVNFILIFNFFSYSQNGTYQCNKQAYSKSDNSANELYSDKQIITIEIIEAIGGYISINNISEDLNFKYDILSKDHTITDKVKRTITNTYIAKMSMLNNPVGDEVIIGIVESMDNDSISFWVYYEKFKASNQYLNLQKLK